MSHLRMVLPTVRSIPRITRDHDAFNIDELKTLAAELADCRAEILAEIDRRRRFKVIRDGSRRPTPSFIGGAA